MRLAFYAPMKPPDHGVPSGDRSIAQAVIAALDLLGAQVDLASRLQSRDGAGNPSEQARLIKAAAAQTEALVRQGKEAGWQAWVTYHTYYKAPDLLGPSVSAALNIPYLQIEATRAKKRLRGEWALFAQKAEAAIDAADVVFSFTERDSVSLRDHAPDGQHLIRLDPFLRRTDLPPTSTLAGPMLAVGMMRHGDKLASYRLLAETMLSVSTDAWQLDLAGDGAARAEVEAAMAPFGDRVRFLGKLGTEALATCYQTARLLIWPGVNEALGLVYLEAMAAGVPVVAQHRPGMAEVLGPGAYPKPEAGTAALARRVETLLADTAECRKLAQAGRERVQRAHLLPAAAQTLARGLAAVGVTP